MSTASQSARENLKGKYPAIVAMFFLFAMIAFVTNLAAPLGTIWKGQYEWAGMIGNFMNFLAYLIMGIPAGNLLLRIGYKKTALSAITIGALGIALQYASSVFGAEVPVFTVSGYPVMLNYIIYLIGAFIGGFCVCMLNTVVNPMLNTLGGGGNTGNQLIQLGGTLNSLTASLTPLLVGMLIGEVTKTTSMNDVTTLLMIAFAVFAVAFVIISLTAIPEPNTSADKKRVKFTHSAWSFRHTVLGVVGIFFYVGIEVGIPGELIFYLQDSTESGITINAAAIATAVAAIYWFMMLIGRLLSSMVSGKISSRTQLTFMSALAIILVMLAIFIPSSCKITMLGYSVSEGFTTALVPLSALFLVLCGLCTSIMWGGIFNLAVEGLGKYTAQASGIFMMMVVGGGVIPLVQNAIAGPVGYLNSYWLIAVLLAYLFYYAISGSKNVNKDIPVSEEEEEEALRNTL